MIYRIDVRPRPGGVDGEMDPRGNALRHQIAELGLKARIGAIATSRIFLIDSDADLNSIGRVARELLADPIVELAEVVTRPPADEGRSRIEVHLKAGVMDPVAASTEMAIGDLKIPVRQVRTGRGYLIDGKLSADDLQKIATRLLANGVIESVHFQAYIPAKFETGRENEFDLRSVSLVNLSNEQLAKLSREGHLFLSLAEMKAIQNYFAAQGREPTDIELETLAQTWSEHCVHKTLKSAVDVEVRDAQERVMERRRYGNLIKETIFNSTMELMKGSDKGKKDSFCLSVFKDNAGVVAFDETDAVCFKVETHNHPSAIEPYGGSATGAGGVIRDILGTGLAAKPIANTDVFCVAFPNFGSDGKPLPRGVIHPKRVLQQVVAGVRDYGNRMGIPTVNGAVYFDNRYLGNPLVFCGCVGLIPRNKIEKAAVAGDAIVVMGGRTGRDGIHGATFSSAELTDTHADEFSHAVQIGDAITEKKVADVILEARDMGLFTGITDCGAGGLSSAVGEMGEKTGAIVDLEKVPLKYAGLRYDEIWISEAQERMVLSVPAEHVDKLLALSAAENVEATVIGKFGAAGNELILNYRGKQVGRLSMEFLHNGIPTPTRKAVIVQNDRAPAPKGPPSFSPAQIKQQLLEKLAHPNIASKHWIIRQYDHEVQGGSVIKPLTGPLQTGPSDAAVVRPKLSSYRGVALGCGMSPQINDPYDMALASIDEAIRNVVAVGADPDRIAILDNFCWPSVDDEKTMGTLVRACEACRDAAMAYRIPFISGKDSLHNQFTIQETGEVLRIPPTLLISAIGVIEDVRHCVTMDLKKIGNIVSVIRTKDKSPAALAKLHRLLSKDIRAGRIVSCHDISDGGLLVAAAEMCIASGLGIRLESGKLTGGPFDEPVGEYLIEHEIPSPGTPGEGSGSGDCPRPGKGGGFAQQSALRPHPNPPPEYQGRGKEGTRDSAAADARSSIFAVNAEIEIIRLGFVQSEPRFMDIAITDLTAAWQGTLDW
jgi:phosphoribosylformylglycinamidine synthase